MLVTDVGEGCWRPKVDTNFPRCHQHHCNQIKTSSLILQAANIYAVYIEFNKTVNPKNFK